MNKKQLTPMPAYNEAVHSAYYSTLKYAKRLLSSIEHEELRYTLIREDQPVGAGIIHEFVNPLFYLRLEMDSEGQLLIRYGHEQFDHANNYSSITALFTRYLYSVTSKSTTTLNIENCVRTEWLLTHCSEMYEQIEERNKYHRFEQIKFKVTSKQRKRLLSVA